MTFDLTDRQRACIAWEIPRDPIADAIQRGDRATFEMRQKLAYAAVQVVRMLMDAGQKVSIKDTECQKPEQLGVPMTIRHVIGAGADAFVSLLAPDASIAEWFRADELRPAMAITDKPSPGETLARTTGRTIGKVRKHEKLKARMHTAIGKTSPAASGPYDTGHREGTAITPPTSTPNCRPEDDEGAGTLIAAARRLAAEHRITYTDAMRIAEAQHPAAVKAYQAAVEFGPQPIETVAGADAALTLAQDTAAREKISLKTAVHRLPGASLAGYRGDPPSVLSLSDGDAATSPDATIETKARELMAADKKLSYSDAVLRVQQDDPELYRAWKDDRHD